MPPLVWALHMLMAALGTLLLGLTEVSGQDANQVTGRERLAWDLRAVSPSELAELEHLVYVDGTATPVDGLVCDAAANGGGFTCSSRLPFMTPGSHTIVVGTRYRGRAENAVARSLPLNLDVAAGATSTDRSVKDSKSESVKTVDGIRLTRAIVAAGLNEPTDIATLPDGRLLVSERAGRIYVLSSGDFARALALALDDCETANEGGLLAIAVDPAFASTRHVYVLYTRESGLRLARYEEADGRLWNRTIIAEGLPISRSRPAATFRIGDDRKIYLALGIDVEAERDRDPFSGKVLRLNLNGSTPIEHTSHSPVLGIGLNRPTGMAWRAADATVWVIGETSPGEIKSLAHPSSVERSSQHWALPQAFGLAKIAVYGSEVVPAMRGDLLIAGNASSSLLRVRIDENGKVWQTEWIYSDQVGSIRAVAVANDGSIFVAGRDQLVRLRVSQ